MTAATAPTHETTVLHVGGLHYATREGASSSTRSAAGRA